jgi:hypothetical protein
MSYRPDIHDFFPKTRRGHGSTHPQDRVRDNVTVRSGCRCVNPACSLLRRQDESGKSVKGEAHDDPKANVEEWKADHGYKKDTPLEYCR